jgi:Glycosyltransferase 61
MTISWRRRLARQRRRFGRALMAAAAGRLAAEMPKRGIESIEKFLWRPDVSRHVVHVEAMHEPTTATYAFDPEYPEYFRRRHSFPPRLIYRLKDVIVSPFTGLVWTPKTIFNESLGSATRIMEWSQALDDVLLPVGSLSEQRTLIACPSLGFYHWLIESLPNVITALERWPDLALLLPTDPPSYLVEAIALVFDGQLPSERIVHADGPLRVARLIMPAVDFEGGFCRPEDIEALRRRILPAALKAAPTTGGKGTRVYISRRNAPLRPLAGEELLERELAARGFRIFNAEHSSFAAQVAEIASAGTIVAPHGAGLAHLVWADPPCRVIELFRSDCVNDCFANIAVSRGLQYEFLVCRPTAPHVDKILIGEILAKLSVPQNA